MAGAHIRGTREWAVANIDCCTGCSHGCRYCYARYDAVVNKKHVTAAQWHNPVVRTEDVERTFPYYDGQVMFPTTHDIFPSNVEACIQVLQSLLDAGNRVLIVSKPHFDSIKRICHHFQDQMDEILLRFTITANDDTVLHFWEPGAPLFEERMRCLRYAYSMGYHTSVSVEPILDSNNVVQLVEELVPWVTHSIWLGKMNKIDRRVVCDSWRMELELERIEKGQSNAQIRSIYKELRDNPLIYWKDSIKEVVGISPPREAGQDI